MAFEEEAQVEERAREQAPVFEQQRHEQTTDASVAVEVGMDGLEPCVEQTRPDHRWQVSLLRAAL